MTAVLAQSRCFRANPLEEFESDANDFVVNARSMSPHELICSHTDANARYFGR